MAQKKSRKNLKSADENIKPSVDAVTEIPKKEEKHIEEGLNAIYGKGKVDFSKMDRSRSRLTNILMTAVIALAIMAAAAWSGFFVYTNYFSNPRSDAFTLEIQANQEMVSGDSNKITIHYANPTSVPIATLKIEAKIPTGFQVTKMTPEPTAQDEMVWDIGSLSAGSDGNIELEGVWFAGAPSQTPIQALADFRPANFNADFQDVASLYITTTTSSLTPTWAGAEEGRAGEKLKYSIEVNNAGKNVFNKVEVKLTLPSGFFLESSQPAITAGAAPVWTFDKVDAAGKQTINFEGSFASDVEGFQYFDVAVGVKGGEQTLPQSVTQGFTDVLANNLSMQLVANGSSDSVATEIDAPVRLGLSIENQGDTNIEDLSLLLDFQAAKVLPIKWSEAQLDEGKITADGVLWDSENLGILTAKEKRILNLSLPIKGNFDESLADSFTVVAVATIGDFTVKSKPIVISVNSEAYFKAQARYFTDEGAPLGIGPLPPTKGQTTTYRLVWRIENKLHDLNNVKVQALLPPYISWQNQSMADLGKVSFDPATKMVTWEIAQLPKTTTKVEAYFPIAITPDQNDVGTFVKLISGSTFTATDAVTAANITKSTESITSELPDDSFAAGKGAVIE